MEKTFCEVCRRDVTFSLESVIEKTTLRGGEYVYPCKKAFCSTCRNEVFVHEVEDDNLKALYDAYREKNHIISSEQILEISTKYDIDKHALSLILGCDEESFSRYCEGLET
jgi:ferredoxin